MDKQAGFRALCLSLRGVMRMSVLLPLLVLLMILVVMVMEGLLFLH